VVLKRVKRENVVAGQERKEKSRPEKKRSSFFFKKKSSRRRPLASDAPSRSFRPLSRPRASRSWSRVRRNRGAGSTPPEAAWSRRVASKAFGVGDHDEPCAHLVEEHPVDVLLGDDADRAFRRGVDHDYAPYFFVHQGRHDARQLVFGHGGHALRGGHHETRHRRHVFSPREWRCSSASVRVARSAVPSAVAARRDEAFEVSGSVFRRSPRSTPLGDATLGPSRESL